MAGSMLLQTIVAFVGALMDSWKTTSDVPIEQPKDTQSSWDLLTLWESVSHLVHATPRPVVVLGDSPTAFVTLLDLAHKLSPELVITIFFIGIVCIVAFVCYVSFHIIRVLIRLLTTPCRRRSAPARVPFEQLSETAQQVYAYVRAQNPELFANGPDPPTPPRTRQRRHIP